ncbi:MAG: hypothetical protein MJY87_07005 [Fibrobacter sp.]|nr:hypothetical protein [Fibrobacter sp.]
MIRLILLLLAALFFSACDNALFEEDGDTTLRQLVYIVPENFSGDAASSLYPTQTSVVELGHSVKFIAGYTINGVQSTHDSTARYYTSVLWDIDGEYFNINTFRYTFNKPGVVYGSLRTIDLYGDTLTSDLVIYVNTPENISLEYPYNGFNQVIPDKATSHTFRWNITGIDEWETARCEFFIDTDSNSVWNSSMGEVDCASDLILWGPLTDDSLTLAQMGVDLRKNYLTYYWGVKYSILTEGAIRKMETSEVNRFTTKFLDPEKSVLYVPIRYEGFSTLKAVNTSIIVVSALGDTLYTGNNSSPKITLILDLPPQSGMTVYLNDISRKEFTGDTLQVDLPAGSVVRTREAVFTDKVPPQIATVKDTLGKGEPIKFYIYDDGSGINVNKLAVFLNGEKIDHEINGNILSIHPVLSYKNAGKVQILAEDNSQNHIPGYHWKASEQEDYSIIVTGPFPDSEEAP